MKKNLKYGMFVLIFFISIEIVKASNINNTKKPGVFEYFIGILIYLAIFTPIVIKIIKLIGTRESGSKVLDFSRCGKIPADTPIFRDIPCNKDIYRAYWVAYHFDLLEKKTDFFGTILLKWLYEDKIKIESKENGALVKREESNIIFKSNVEFDIELEKDLYNYMYEASHDGILEKYEFSTWCHENYNRIDKWFDQILNYENDILIEEGKLLQKIKTTIKIFKTIVYEIEPSMIEEAKQMRGLKDFFREFENIQDKEAIEVKFWQYYSMYAQILGVADKVPKQFRKLYPNIITDSSSNSTTFIHNVSELGMSKD